MGTFYPRLEDPGEDIIDVVENVIRRGLPQYGIPSPPWSGDDPCPSGHWFLPDGTRLYRYDLPDSVEPPSIAIGLEANSTRRHVDDAKYWDVPCLMLILWANDVPAGVWRTIVRRLESVFSNGVRDAAGNIIEPTTYFSRGGAMVHYLKEFQLEAVKEQESRPMISLRFTAFASARRLILSTTGDLLTSPDGFTLTH
jgi:hypothetical protein